MNTSLATLLAALPGPATATWPEGEPFTPAFAHGSMSLEIFAPRGTDRQSPHAQDELYIVATGTAVFERDGARLAVAAGDALFVPAGMDHRFHAMSADFVTWVIFWGPAGGEPDAGRSP